ncbi:MAG: hypothetical protein NC218_00275 [Acetobacter sp.]|nr:hypothetical protein [Acetobacter sp.]
MSKEDAVFWPICLNLLYSFPKWSWDKRLFLDPAEEKGHYLTPQAWRIYSILNAIDLGKPANCRSFLRNVQHMHKYQFSLYYLNTYGNVSDVYAKEMVTKKLITPEIEEVYIRYAYKNLMYDINDAGHKWSPKAKKLIKKLHPRTYQHFFQK